MQGLVDGESKRQCEHSADGGSCGEADRGRIFPGCSNRESAGQRADLREKRIDLCRIEEGAVAERLRAHNRAARLQEEREHSRNRRSLARQRAQHGIARHLHQQPRQRGLERGKNRRRRGHRIQFQRRKRRRNGERERTCGIVQCRRTELQSRADVGLHRCQRQRDGECEGRVAAQ